MRDIRKDIKERIESALSQREHLESRLEELDERVASLKNLLAQEESEWQARQPRLIPMGDGQREVTLKSDLSRFLLDVLKDGNPHNTLDLTELAKSEDIPFKGKSPRRAIHFTLVGMKNNNLVEMVESRVWKIHKNGNGEASQ